MSVFGSLYTAVSGLSSQSTSISCISNNIANVSTVGYKRSDTEFATLVTSSSASSYSPGSVRSVAVSRITSQGTLAETDSDTDIAISGNGFFVVATDTDGTASTYYTRSGSFSSDENGYLVNSSGYYLMGWALDNNEQLPASQADITSLSIIDVSFLGGLASTTTSAEISLNLDSDEVDSAYPAGTNFSADFSRSLTVYDSLGEAQELTVKFIKVDSPTAAVTGNESFTNVADTMSTAGYITTAGASITLNLTTDAGAPYSYTVADAETKTISQIITELNSLTDTDGNKLVYAALDDNGDLNITARNIGDTFTLSDNAGTAGAYLTALGFTPAAGVVAVAAPVTAAGADLLTSLDSDEDVNTEGWWTVQYSTEDGTVVESGLINFTGSGALNANPTSATDGSVNIALNDIDWGNGSAVQDITFDISGFTQFSGEYNVVSSNQNGAELGLLTGVTIDNDGYVVAEFSNGESKKIYKIAVATFSNPNGLTEVSGNAYKESEDSGSYNLREAGEGGAGTITSGALESSNVDLADEFANMIVTQRAYSANTKIISTVDQMLSELLQLR